MVNVVNRLDILPDGQRLDILQQQFIFLSRVERVIGVPSPIGTAAQHCGSQRESASHDIGGFGAENTSAESDGNGAFILRLSHLFFRSFLPHAPIPGTGRRNAFCRIPQS